VKRKVYPRWWPRGRWNGQPIVGVSFKFKLDLFHWRWLPVWLSWCGGLHWLCVMTWTEWVFDDFAAYREETS
jgi:hypothetical protein